MSIQTYTTGTASVSADGTVVTIAGGIMTAGNAREGDEFVIGSARALILDVVDATHLTITPWSGANETDAAYTIYQISPRRFDTVDVADALAKQVAALDKQGYPVIVPDDAEAPDPSLGNESQPAIQFNSWLWWKKIAGEWAAQGTPAGMLPAKALAEIAALGSVKQAEARENIGASEVGDALYTAESEAAARTALQMAPYGPGCAPAPSDDANAIVANGPYYITDNGTGVPFQDWWVIDHRVQGGVWPNPYATQVAYPLSGGGVFRRRLDNGTWLPWQTFGLGDLVAANNLSDVEDATAALTNLGAAASADFAASLASSGYQKLPSGFIVQWMVSQVASASYTQSFPVTFPNACFGVSASFADSAAISSDSFVGVLAGPWTTDDVIVQKRAVVDGGYVQPDSSAFKVVLLAIGY